jgi:hypothetical protein
MLKERIQKRLKKIPNQQKIEANKLTKLNKIDFFFLKTFFFYQSKKIGLNKKP